MDGDRHGVQVVAVRLAGGVLAAMPLLLLPGEYDLGRFPKLVLLAAAAFLLTLPALVSPVRRIPSSVLVPLLLFLGLMGLQTIRSLNPTAVLIPLAYQVSCTGVLLGAGWWLRREDLPFLLTCSALGGGLAGAVGVLEAAGFGHDLLPSVGRPSGTFGFRNAAAAYLAVSIPLSAWLGFRGAKPGRWVGPLSAALMLGFLVQTRTRGAWLGLAAGLGGAFVLMLLTRKEEGRRLNLRGSRPLWTAAVLSVLLMGVPQRLDDKAAGRLDERKHDLTTTVLSAAAPGGDRGRFDVWRGTLRMIADHPVSGVGLGNWGALFPLYDDAGTLVLSSDPRRPHNEYLRMWAELGTPALLCFLWLVTALGCTALQAVRCDDGGLGLFVSAGLAAYLVHAFFSFPTEWAAPSLLFWLGAGMLLAARDDNGMTDGRFDRRVPAALAAAACAAALMVAVQAVRFDRELYRAVEAEAAGDWDAQTQAADRAVDMGVFDHRALLVKGHGLFRMGQAHTASRAYRRLLELRPNSASAFNNLGRSAFAAGAVNRARDAFEVALSLQPDNRVVLNNLALVAEREGRIGEALETLDRAASPPAAGGTDLRGAQAHLNRALILARSDSLSAAIRAYEAALALDPSLLRARYSIAGLHLILNHKEAAAVAYEDLLARADSGTVYARRSHLRLGEIYPVLADSLLAASDLDGARRSYERLVELGEARAPHYNNLALLRRRGGDLAGALAAARKGRALDPGFSRIYFTMGAIQEAAGYPDSAAAAYRFFLEGWEGGAAVAEEAKRRLKALER